MKLEYSSKIWFSPKFPIYNLWILRSKLGQIVLSGNKFQKDREAWIVSVALLGIIKMTGQLWWLQIPEDDPPDILAMSLTPNTVKGWNELNHRNIEVMEITKHTKNNIVAEILSKLKGMYYEKETCLVVYLRRDQQISDMRQLSKELLQRVHNISDIWILGNTRPDSNDFVLFSVFPAVEVENFNIDEEVAKLPPGDTLEVERAKGLQPVLVKGIFAWKFNPKR